MQKLFCACVVALAALSSTGRADTQTPSPTGGGMLVYFGTYTRNTTSKGIYVSHLDPATGTLDAPQLAAESSSPSFLAVHPTERFIYAVNEINTAGGNTAAGGVTAFAIERGTGLLKMLNQQSSEGAGPAHLTVDREGRNVLVANYGGGSIAVLPLGRDGKLKSASAFVQHTGKSVNSQRQQAPHAHSITLDPANIFAYVADLGLDRILIYQFDGRKGLLTLNNPSSASVQPGAGPRHFSIHPSGRFGYVINEMGVTVTAFTNDPARGELKEMQTLSALPPKMTVQQSYSGAELEIHPSGRFLYTSIRGHNSIALFTIDQNTGRLTYVENTPTQGNTPRGFGIDPDGKYLVAGNQSSDSVVVFRIDPQTGKLTPTGSKIQVGAPVCVKFVR